MTSSLLSPSKVLSETSSVATTSDSVFLGAQLYFFRGICHDWSDKHCRTFLSNTVQAMDKNSRLLINEFVLPDKEAALLPSLLDIMMMSMVSGLERTESQWRCLLESIGLEIVKVWTVPQGAEAVIETKLKETDD